MPSQLQIYNKALRHIGQRKLSATTDDVEARYVLDDQYTDALAYCLRQGFWNFAMRAIRKDADLTPEYGYSYGFTKPADWSKTFILSASENYDPPLIDYQDQWSCWLANIDPLYIRYVSSTRGTDPSLFPIDYTEYVAAYLALRIFRPITGKSEEAYYAFEKAIVKKALTTAKGNDAMDQAPGRFPQGSWVSSRSGGYGNERGSRSRLIG
jgi:tetratricopeptide (TPR) repeat protein